MFGLLLLSCATTKGSDSDPVEFEAISELELEKVLFNQDGNDQLSALALDGAQLLSLDDRKQKFYRLSLLENGFKPVGLDKFSAYTGYKKYRNHLKHKEAGVKKHVDPEGLAICKDRFYVANEVQRHLLQFNRASKTFSYIDLSHGPGASKGHRNAGFEGVAVDCRRQLAVIAKEREPHKLYLVDLSKKTILKAFDLPQSWRSKQRVINPINGGKDMLEVGDSYSGLFLEYPFLYVLNRSTYSIVKVDLEDPERQVERRSFYSVLGRLYDDPMPFGVAEGLAMSGKRIFIVVDNNKAPVSKVGRKLGGEDDQSALLVFKRKGF